MKIENLIISGAPIDPDNTDRDFLQVRETSYGEYILLIYDKIGNTKFKIEGAPKLILKLVLDMMEIWSDDKYYNKEKE